VRQVLDKIGSFTVDEERFLVSGLAQVFHCDRGADMRVYMSPSSSCRK
jgi:hypothetical protein